VGHKVDPVVTGSPLTISTTQSLTPITLSCPFAIDKIHYQDEEALNALAIEAAYRVVAAEEAVLLLGKDARSFLEALNVETRPDDALDVQIGLHPDLKSKVDQSILASVLQGIANLGGNAKNRRLRNYVVIVSLDLYELAFKNRETPFDAPIYEILPLLVKDGFLYSQALPEKTGLLFSQSGQPIKIAVPIDAYVCADTEVSGRVTLRVEEQIRLVIDVPEAVVALQ
jgi:uncharacterized linocin/CFP29 family protein